MGTRVPLDTRAIVQLMLVLLPLLPTNSSATDQTLLSPANPIQDLITREIRFLQQQQDYLSAIARLRLAQQRQLHSDRRQNAAVLLATLLLDYGLHQRAAAVLRAMQDAGVEESISNRGWQLLAKTLFHKSYLDAAQGALGQITGKVPQDIRGDYQLLRAHVLMALALDEDAAAALRRWEGPPHQAGYAHYNRGVALMRAGDYEGANDALGQVIGLEAKGEKLLALKDKANLALGNLALERNDPQRAQVYFQGVRLQGPFSNRALLGAGWAALERDRKQEALTPWLALRRRSIIDPAVQESLLTVPAVQRELRSLTAAARDYEQAVTLFSSELRRLNAAIAVVREDGVIRLGHDAAPRLMRVSAPIEGSLDVAPESRDLGRLLAGHHFQEAWRGYRDLLSLEKTLADWLRRLDGLDQYEPPWVQANARGSARDASAERRQARAGKVPAKPTPPVGADKDSSPPSGTAWLEHSEPGTSAGTPPGQRRAAPLPEVALPPEHAVNPLPRSQFRGAPTASEVIWLPADPEIRWLPPKPGIKWLPNSDGSRLPNGSSVRLPQADDEQFPHAEFIARESSAPPAQALPGRRMRRPISQHGVAESAGPIASGGNTPHVPPETITIAAPTMEHQDRAVNTTPPGAERFTERIAALRARILALRPRMERALGAHLSYVDALALRELESRRNRLRAFLEQAQLELAKTYDLAN